MGNVVHIKNHLSFNVVDKQNIVALVKDGHARWKSEQQDTVFLICTSI